jgi:pantothenate kinase type III
LSGRGLCDGLITRPGESYRLLCVVVCDQETSKTRMLKSAVKIQPQWVVTPGKQKNNEIHNLDYVIIFITASQNELVM